VLAMAASPSRTFQDASTFALIATRRFGEGACAPQTMRVETDLFPHTAKVFAIAELTRAFRRSFLICHSERSRGISNSENDSVFSQSDMQLTADFFQQTAKVLTVSELTRSIRGTLHLSFRAKSRNL
jgi:hypothetical protein